MRKKLYHKVKAQKQTKRYDKRHIKDRRRTRSYMYDMLKIDKSSVYWG